MQASDGGSGDGSGSPAPRRRSRVGSALLPSDGSDPPLGVAASTAPAADGADAASADAPVPSRGRRWHLAQGVNPAWGLDGSL